MHKSIIKNAAVKLQKNILFTGVGETSDSGVVFSTINMVERCGYPIVAPFVAFSKTTWKDRLEFEFLGIRGIRILLLTSPSPNSIVSLIGIKTSSVRLHVLIVLKLIVTFP